MCLNYFSFFVLQSRDTLRLQGFKQFKWKKKQSMMRVKTRLKEVHEKLTLWRGTLKKIEGYYGIGVVSFFLFVKWLIFLNVILSIILFVFIILPTIYSKNYRGILKAKNIAIFSNGNGYGSVDSGNTGNGSRAEVTSVSGYVAKTIAEELFDRLFDINSTVTSPLYYAYYSSDCTLDFYYFKLDLPTTYILATILCFSFSFVHVLKNAACGFKDRLLESQGQFYVYCNIAFSGWDFCIQDERSAKVKHKALYNEILGRLNVEKRRNEQRNRTKLDWAKLCFIRFVVNLIVIVSLAVVGYIIFLAFMNQYSATSVESQNWYAKIFREFSPAGLIISFNLVVPFFFHRLVPFEHFDPIFSIQLTVFRTILLRFSSLCVLLGSVHQMVTMGALNETDCWESYLARELYKLLILNVVAQILYTFLVNFPRSLLAKHCNNKFMQYIGKQEFDVPSHVLDIVYLQTIVWLGSFYAPFLPTFGVLIITIVFYVKKFACLVNCSPATDVYYASRSHSLYMSILLISFIFSILPWAYSLVEMRPSRLYGPFASYDTVWEVVRNIFDHFPNWLSRLVTFCVSSTFVVPLIVLLLLTNYYYYAVYVVNRQMVLVLKRQLILEGHDKQFLLNRLSAFIKQQQERYHPNQMSVNC